MQAINLIQDNYQETYCVIDPLLCLSEARHISSKMLIQCRFCKSICLPVIKNGKSECMVCKCYTDLPEGYAGGLNQQQSPIILTQQTLSKNFSEINKSKRPISNLKSIQNPINIPNCNKLRLLIVYQSKLGQEYSTGLQCLADILPEYGELEICLITYDTQIKLIELQSSGRVLVISEDSMELINDKFYPVTQESLSQLFEVLSSDLINKKLTLNSTKIMVEILQHINHSSTIVLWLGSLCQDMQFYSYPSYPNTDIYPILKIPYSVTSHTQIEVLNNLNKNSTRTKYILKADSVREITEKVHYGLYEIFQNYTISHLKIQSSRERKYPPEILTSKNRILGSLRNNVIVKLGKFAGAESIQVRIKYASIKPELAEENQQNQVNNVQVRGKQQLNNKVLIINFKFTQEPGVPSQQLYKYIQLFKFAKVNPTPLQMQSLPYNENVDIDIMQFFRECSYLQKQELFANIQNPNCIYTIWPWVGVQPKNKSKEKRLKFMFYFTGYFISQTPTKKKILPNEENENQLEDQYSQQIQQLNQLCQVLYSQRDKNLPNYYAHVQQEICPPSHLVDSDEEEQLEERYFEATKCDGTYYPRLELF